MTEAQPFACWLRAQRYRRDRVGCLARAVLGGLGSGELTETPRTAAALVRWQLRDQPDFTPYHLAAAAQAAAEYEQYLNQQHQPEGVTP